MAAQAKRRGGGLQRLIEERLVTPVFCVVLFFAVTTAAETFSGGVIDLPHIMGPLFGVWQVIRGLGMGFGSELLAVISGRSWRVYKRDEAEIREQRGLSKVQRTARAAHAKSKARENMIAMFVGICGSIYASAIYYIKSASHVKTLDLVSDIVATILATAVLLYIGVFKDSKAEDQAEEMVAGIQSGVTDSVHGAIDRFKQGVASDVDLALIAEHLPEQDRVKFRRAVAKKVDGEMWTTAMIRQALGYGNDSTMTRKVNAKVNQLSRQSELGLRRGDDGRSWLIPRHVVMDVWGEEIGAAKAMARLLNGRSSVSSSDAPTPTPDVIRMFPGRDPDTGEATA